jgi:hypothetical protein
LKRLLIVLCVFSLTLALGSQAFAGEHRSGATHAAGSISSAPGMGFASAGSVAPSSFDPMAFRVPPAGRSLSTVGGSDISSAVQLPEGPVTGSVDSAGHPDDVYRFYLEPGATIVFRLDATAGSNTELWLYPPTATSLAAGGIGGDTRHTFPEYDSFTSSAGGYYYIDVYSGASGSSSYSLDYYIDSHNDYIPGVAITASPVTGWLDYNWDWDDVYRLPLRSGDRLTLTLSERASASNTPDFDADLFLYGPWATTLYNEGDGSRVVGVAASAHDAPAVEVVSVTATHTGNYYADVYDYAGNGTASLAWSVTPIRPSIKRAPAASKLTYKRKKGVAKFTLSGRFTNQFGLPIKGLRVILQTSKNGKKWKSTYAITTNSNGTASKAFKVKKKGTTYYRWYRVASSTMTKALSGTQKVVIK